MDLKIALRNVFRNRRRTALSLAVIVVGTAIFLLTLAFIGETLRSSRTAIVCETGAVQVADRRLFEDETKGYDYLISPELRDRVVALVVDRAGVTGTGWRLDFAGLVGNEKGSTLILGRGLTTCSCVENYDCFAIEGGTLPSDDSREVVLGRALAAKLGVGIGDPVNVATGTASGNFNAATVTMVGSVTYSTEAVEKQLGLFSAAFVQRLLKTDGVARILIGLEDPGAAADFAAALQRDLDAQGIPLVTRTWEELSSSYGSLKTFYTAFSGLAGIAVFVLVFFSVFEILTISFLERTREVGTVRALGTTRGRVFRGFLLEGAAIGILGAGLGIAAGALVSVAFNAIGFTSTPPGGAVPQALRLELSAGTTVVPFLTVVLATLVSSIYPAWKSSRLRVVQALQSV
jgi:putative ABC transport system permease protein